MIQLFRKRDLGEGEARADDAQSEADDVRVRVQWDWCFHQSSSFWGSTMAPDQRTMTFGQLALSLAIAAPTPPPLPFPRPVSMPFPLPFPTKAPVAIPSPSLSLSPCPNVPFDLAEGGPLADSPPSLPGEILRI